MDDTQANGAGATWCHPELWVLAALGLGVAYERLLYDRPVGLSYPLWLLLCLGVLFVMARRDGQALSRWAWGLTVHGPGGPGRLAV